MNCVPATVKIRRNADGVTREALIDFAWDLDEGSRFIWEEGNYSCDCNRLLFFMQAAGEPQPPFGQIPCSDGAYSVLSIQLDDGNIVYREEGR